MTLDAARLHLDAVGKTFRSGPFWRRQEVHALQRVSLAVASGATVGVLGESGSGKTTLMRVAAFLLRADEGHVWLDGADPWSMSREERRWLRRRVQIVFQEGSDSLDPRQTVTAAVGEPLANFGIPSRLRVEQVAGALEAVGLPPELAGRYPGEMSGGQRQRVGLARSLVLEPRLLLLDEPVSALDVSIGAQVLNLLRALQQQRGLGYVLISHELPVVRYLADNVLVLYAGLTVEEGPAAEVLDRPCHPYTVALRAAALTVAPGAGLQDVPAAAPAATTGCPYSSRCPAVMPVCRERLPPVFQLGVGHHVRCFLFENPKEVPNTWKAFASSTT